MIGVHSLDHAVTLDEAAVAALQWWLSPPNVEPGVPLGPFVPQVTLCMDASTQSWGAHAVGFHAKGSWTPQETSLSINSLELLVVQRALLADPPFWQNK